MMNNTMGMTPNNAGMYQSNMRAPQAPVAGGPLGAAMKKGGKVSSASKRADGIARRGKTRGSIV